MRNLIIIRAIILFLISFQAIAATPVIRLNTTGQPPLNTDAQNGFMDAVAT